MRLNKLPNLEDSLQDIWCDAERLLLAQSKDYLNLMQSKNLDLYMNAIFVVLYHNGYLQNYLVDQINETDRDYILITAKTVVKGVTLYCLADYCKGADGDFGEDLMKFLVITNKGKTFNSFAAASLTFHTNSIAHQCQLQVLLTGDASEFDLSELELLENPTVHLQHRLIKVSNTIKPDGLSISELAGGFTISVWHSKNWKDHLDAAAIETALELLDPMNFFKSDSHKRTTWLEKRTDAVWRDKYIRVIWATVFTAAAISKVNKYNINEENVNRPVVLINHALLPKEIGQKYTNLPKKQAKERRTNKNYSFQMKWFYTIGF